MNHAVQKKRPIALSIRELAADLGMSTSNLRTRFRASCGVSLCRHMRELRLERARGLLRLTSVRIAEIADALSGALSTGPKSVATSCWGWMRRAGNSGTVNINYGAGFIFFRFFRGKTPQCCKTLFLDSR